MLLAWIEMVLAFKMKKNSTRSGEREQQNRKKGGRRESEKEGRWRLPKGAEGSNGS